MNRLRPLKLILQAGISAGLLLIPSAGHADTGQLSPERFDALDRQGYFTPAFKKAVHDLVDTRQALAASIAQEKKLSAALPDLQQHAAAEEAKAVMLREELAKYEHPDEVDFAALQSKMSDPSTKPDELRVLAQAYVWTYATSPHAAEAQQILDGVEKKMADSQKAQDDAQAARVAARAKLVARAQAHDLSLVEWREFLNGLTQEEVQNYFGPPTSQQGDFWTYGGQWVDDPALHRKVGLVIDFDGGRVLSVAEPPPPR
jgi:hypothetical protein